MGEFSFCRKEPANAAVRIPDIIPRPVGARVASRLGIDAVGDRLYEGSPLRISKDRLKEGGRFLPIRSTRRRIPVAAFWLKKYFSGTSPASMQGNNVDSTALLGDSEMFRVKHTPCDVIPAPVQRLENDCEVSSSVGTKKAVDVFEDNCPWLTRSNEAHKVVKESRLVPSKPRPWPHSRKAEVLAWESGCPDVRLRNFCVIENPDVFVERETGPVLLEDLPAERLHFALKNDLEASPLQAEVQAPDSTEEGRNFVAQGFSPKYGTL
nr:hypothetical protein [Rhizobium leguminosarum]